MVENFRKVLFKRIPCENDATSNRIKDVTLKIRYYVGVAVQYELLGKF